MNFYKKYVLPFFINTVMQNDELAKEREKYVPLVSGRVLEIGGGSGTNIPFLKNIEKLIIIEPSKELLQRAEKRIASSTFPIEVIVGSAENIPLPDNSMDNVLSTWTLCSIPDVSKALREVKRVLKPGGQFIFVEHGKSPDKFVARLQTLSTPIWKRLAGGCHLDRKIDDLIKEAGLDIIELKVEYTKGLRTSGYFYKGIARKN